MNALVAPLAEPSAIGPDSRSPLPHRHGLDLLQQILEAGYLEILSRGDTPGDGAGEAPAVRTALMLDGDVIVQVSHSDLEPALWDRHQALVTRRLGQLHRTLRWLTALAIGGGLGAFLGLTGLLQIFETFRFASLDVTRVSSWALHAVLPLAIPAAITVALRVALRVWLKHRADRVFGKLRL